MGTMRGYNSIVGILGHEEPATERAGSNTGGVS